MTNAVGGLASESVKSLGPGAALVSALPSTTLVVTVVGLTAGRLYPWMDPATDDEGRELGRGFPSITQAIGDLNGPKATVLVLAVLLLTVMLRPMQISLVRLLEGYWDSRALTAVRAVAVERHIRRQSRHRAQSLRARTRPGRDVAAYDFHAVALWARRDAGLDRAKNRTDRILAHYPQQESLVMPTVLGNVLRHTETTAGERYGMDTVLAYRRLYPFISARLHAALAVRFDLLDVTSAFTVIFLVQTVLAAPLLYWAADASPWALLPLAFAAMAAISYAGALVTARHHGELLFTAFDLHRFDMYGGLHHPLPTSLGRERRANRIWMRFMYEEPDAVPTPNYEHPSAVDQALRSVLGSGQEPPGTGPSA